MGTKAELAGIVSDVVSYFQISPPTDKALDLWIKKLDGLNLGAARNRIVDIITNGEGKPRNFPVAVKAAYSTWLRDQPRERQRAEGCGNCLEGLIYAKKEGNSFVFRCGHCNSPDVHYPKFTRYQLEQGGYILDWTHDYKGPVDFNLKNEIKKILGLSLLDRQRGQSEPEIIPFNGQF